MERSETRRHAGVRTATVGIHGGQTGADGTGSAAVPIYQTVAYAYDTAEQLAAVFEHTAPGYIYTRIANPTTVALETTLAELEGGIGCIATASGMAAITSVVMGLVTAGDELVAAAGIFGGTISLFENVLRRFDVKTHFVEAGDTQAFAGAVSSRTKLLFVETIGNPRMDVPDLPALAQIAQQANIPLVVDSTVTTPALVRPGELGADLVVHSTSKFINGHGTALGGAIIDTGNYDWSRGPFPELRQRAATSGRFAFLAYLRNVICRDLGGCPAPMNSFLMLQGLATLVPRMVGHCANAEKLARFLSDHPEVARVNYPGLLGHPAFDRAVRQFGGRAGGLLTFGLGSRKRAFRFLGALRLARNMANLGDAKTLVLHPSSTIYHEFEPAVQQRMGVSEDMIRVSVGLEDFEDIRQDFQQAIEQSSRK